MPIETQYDVAIIGGGLAGLACAIQASRFGHSVILFEKEQYPFHRVCGEYISLESWNFLQQLGLPLRDLSLPLIDTLLLSAPNGNSFTTRLPLGGFGISRYVLDSQLAERARHNGVVVAEQARVDEVHFDETFQIRFTSPQTNASGVTAKVCCAAYGKRSNLDVKWKRKFLNQQDRRTDNYVGVKYHIRTDGQENVIGLHNFENGYCGISKIEEDRYCLCYMTRSDNLKQCQNSLLQLESSIVQQNPYLKKIWTQSEFLPGFPVTISQINFKKKAPVEQHVLMLGDAAGMITPLCGNGMSIALQTGKMAARLVHHFLKKGISREQMEEGYEQQWQENFARRLQTGRTLQKYFGSVRLSNVFVSLFKTLPFLAAPVIKLTHGEPF